MPSYRRSLLDPRITRRAFLAGASVFGAASLTASGYRFPVGRPTGGSIVPLGQTPASAQIETPRAGGTLRIGRLEDISAAGFPHLLSPANFQVSNLVCDTLIEYDDQLVPRPRLASSWTWSPDFLQLSIQLREGIDFHTGRPFTSEDAKFNLERLRDPAVGSQFRNYAESMHVSAPAPDQLVITYDAPKLSSFDAITLTFIADPQSMAQTATGQAFVGTGPFTFVEWVQGDHVSVHRNSNYWQPGKPYLDGAELRVFRDNQQALIALETGFVDWVVGVAPQDARGLQSDPNYQVLQNANGSTFYYLGLDVTLPALTDKRIRQAFGYAINRQSIVDTVLFGFGRAVSTPWPAASPEYDAVLDSTYTYDPGRARQMLNDAGWTADVPLPLYVSEAQPPTVQMAQIIQADLAGIGVPVVIQTLSQADFVSRLTKGQFQGMWITALSWMQFSPATFFNVAFPVKIPNSSNFTSPDYQMLIDQLSVATDAEQQRQTTDAVTRMLLDEAFVLMIADAATQQSGAEVVRSSVRGINTDRFGLVAYQDVWLDQGQSS